MSDSIPGWYPDPAVTGQQRYWDGTKWTENVAPLPPTVPLPPPVAPPPGYASTPPTYADYGMPTYGQPAIAVTYAHWGLRVGAALLDYLMQVAFAATGILLSVARPDSGSAAFLGFLFILAGAVFAIWNVYVRQGHTGYSLGKQMLGIKLINERSGQPIGAWLCFGRYLLHILDELPVFLGFLWPLWDSKRQTFADKIVGSVVVVVPKPRGEPQPWDEKPTW